MIKRALLAYLISIQPIAQSSNRVIEIGDLSINY